MKKILFVLLLSSFLPACKKDNNTCPEDKVNYTATHTQTVLNVEYYIKTKTTFVATYSKFNGFDSNGNALMLSITDTLTGNSSIKFESTTSPFGYKYHYQIFTTSTSNDTNIIYININGVEKVHRPNYQSVFNFANLDY